MNWQTIDSAPKDRRILLCYPDKYTRYWFAVGSWNENLNAREPRPYWGTELTWIRGKKWHRDNNPTHWAEIVPPEES